MNHYRDIEIKTAADGEGTFQGVLSTYGGPADAYGDVIQVGAFSETIKRNGGTLPLLWSHDQSEPVGTLELRDTPKALEVTGRLVLSTRRGAEAFDLLKAKAVRGLSIGFRAIKDRMEKGLRILETVELYEGSLVAIPANRGALVTDIKSIMDVRSFERFLHQSGWSRSESKRLSGHGWAGLSLPDEDGDDELLSWLRSANAGRA